MPGIPLGQVQNLELFFVEPHEALPDPPFKFVEVTLNGIPSFHCVNCTTQLGVIFVVDLLHTYMREIRGFSFPSSSESPKEEALLEKY